MKTSPSLSTKIPSLTVGLSALHHYEILDTMVEEEFDDVTRLAAHVCQAPIALISLVDGDYMWVKSEVGLSVRKTPLEMPICKHGIEQQGLSIVPDTRLDSRFFNDPLITGDDQVRFYAGAPLVSSENLPIGMLCVMDREPRQLTEIQQKAITTLAKQVMMTLELKLSRRRLQCAIESISDAYFTLDHDYRFTSLNNEAERVLGHSRGELLGRLISDVGDLSTSSPLIDLFQQAVTEQRFVTFEDFHSPSGKWLNARAYPTAEGLTIYLQDVTEQHTKGEQLRLLETCVTHLNDIVLITEAQCIDEPGPRILYVNDAFVRRTGYSREEAIGKSPRFLQGPKTQRDVLDRIRKSLEAFKPVREEIINYTKSGEEFWLELEIMPVADATGQFAYSVAIERDITERKRAEEEWQAAEARHRTLFEYAPDGILICNPETQCLDANASLCGMLGYTCDELTTLSAADIVAQHEVLYIETAVTAIKAKLDHHREWQLRRKDGSIFPAEIMATLMPDGNLLAMIRDITERKHIDEERDKLMQLIENCSDFIALADLEGKVTFMNGGGRRMIGLHDDEDISLLQIKDYKPTDWHTFFRDTILVTALEQGVWKGEMQLRHTKTGALIDILRTTFVIRDLAGNPKFFATVSRDITASKKAEATVRQSEASLAAAQALAHLGSWELDLLNQKGIWSAEMSRMHSHDPTLPAPSFEDFLLAVHPEDRQLLKKSHAGIQKSTVPVVQAYRTNPGIGPLRHLSSTLHAVRDKHGQVTRLVGTTLDITERKQAEKRIRWLVDSNAQGVMFWELNGRVTGANDAYLKLLGYTRENLEAGLINWRSMTPPEYADRDRRAVEELNATGICKMFEKEYIRKDGKRVPVLIGVATFEDNKLEGVCFVIDLTERKKLEQQFLRAQRLESIGTLAGGIAHDLNNVLTPIMMSIELLKMEETSTRRLSVLRTIESSAKRGADMVDQVLSFARGVEGRHAEVLIGLLLNDVAKFANETFLKNIQVHCDVPADLWFVLGDSTQLHQVLINLCVNARDAMPNGGRLALTASNIMLDEQCEGQGDAGKSGPHIVIQVEDTGMGIQPEVLERIFEPFFTTKEFGNGTGLGLSTALAIINSHSGFVHVSSEVGMGTVIRIYLPAQTEKSLPDAELTQLELPRGNGELVLVVDDESAVRQITRQTLSAFGYQVLLAADGAEATTIFASRKEDIAVVLTDMMMPLMDGPATINALLLIDPEVIIIAASGLNADGMVAKATSARVRHFLPKPYTAETLLKVLKQVLLE